jgi:hypothetical protein
MITYMKYLESSNFQIFVPVTTVFSYRTTEMDVLHENIVLIVTTIKPLHLAQAV